MNAKDHETLTAFKKTPFGGVDPGRSGGIAVVRCGEIVFAAGWHELGKTKKRHGMPAWLVRRYWGGEVVSSECSTLGFVGGVINSDYYDHLGPDFWAVPVSWTVERLFVAPVRRNGKQVQAKPDDVIRLAEGGAAVWAQLVNTPEPARTLASEWRYRVLQIPKHTDKKTAELKAVEHVEKTWPAFPLKDFGASAPHVAEAICIARDTQLKTFPVRRTPWVSST